MKNKRASANIMQNIRAKQRADRHAIVWSERVNIWTPSFWPRQKWKTGLKLADRFHWSWGCLTCHILEKLRLRQGRRLLSELDCVSSDETRSCRASLLSILSLHTCIHVHVQWYSHPLIHTHTRKHQHSFISVPCGFLSNPSFYMQENRLKNIFWGGLYFQNIT